MQTAVANAIHHFQYIGTSGIKTIHPEHEKVKTKVNQFIMYHDTRAEWFSLKHFEPIRKISVVSLAYKMQESRLEA